MDPTIVMTMLVSAITALFGLLVAQYRSRMEELKAEIKTRDAKIEILEGRLASRDNVVEKNTETMVKVAESQGELVGMLRDVVERVNRIDGGSSTERRG